MNKVDMTKDDKSGFKNVQATVEKGSGKSNSRVKQASKPEHEKFR